MRVRTEAKREAILAAAARAFMDLGYERASMTEIATRIGGSKATIYGYFESKEQLFVEVALLEGETHMLDALAELEDDPTDLSLALQRFGEKYLSFITQPATLATQRMLIAESGHSDIGIKFFDAGPRRGLQGIGAFIEAAIRQGRLRKCDPEVAAHHLLGLLQAEVLPGLLLGLPTNASRATLRQVATRAKLVFLAAYQA